MTPHKAAVNINVLNSFMELVLPLMSKLAKILDCECAIFRRTRSENSAPAAHRVSYWRGIKMARLAMNLSCCSAVMVRLVSKNNVSRLKT